VIVDCQGVGQPSGFSLAPPDDENGGGMLGWIYGIY